jgi:hypothetical protein
MSVSANEPGQQPTGQAPASNDSGHPAWQEILDQIPDSLHPLVTPVLEKWDKGVKETLQETRSLYDPYKTFVEQKVDPQLLQQAIALVDAINEDPNAVAQDLINSFELDYVQKAELEKLAQQQTPPSNEDDDFLNGTQQFDITKHPAFLEVKQALDTVTGKLTAQEQQEQQAAAKTAHEQQLEALHTGPNGEAVEFDDMFVTALMAQGASGEVAVQQYQSIVNQAAAKIANTSQQQTPPAAPIVMGGDGTTGSGIPDGATKMGDLKRGEVNDLVAQIIARQSQET